MTRRDDSFPLLLPFTLFSKQPLSLLLDFLKCLSHDFPVFIAIVIVVVKLGGHRIGSRLDSGLFGLETDLLTDAQNNLCCQVSLFEYFPLL